MDYHFLVEHYSAMLARDPVHWQAASLTAITGYSAPAGALEALGADENPLGPLTLDQLADHDVDSEPVFERTPEPGSVAWLIELDGLLAVFEPNGFVCSLPDVLSRLAQEPGSRIINFYWNSAIGLAEFTLASNGYLESHDLLAGSLVDRPKSEAQAVLADVATLSPDYRVRGMTAIGVLTGFRLTSHILDGAWPALYLRSRREIHVQLPNAMTPRDPEFALALSNASATARQAAQNEVVRQVLEATGLLDNPVAADTAAILERGDSLEPSAHLLLLLEELDRGYAIPDSDIDPSNPGWRRRQAGNMLFEFSIVRDEFQPRRFAGWLAASLALSDQWTESRHRYLHRLRAHS